MSQKARMILTLLLLTLCLLGSLGFGRFSFGAILPFMKDDLMFTYTQTGFVASSIFFGYLLSAFFSGYFVLRFTAKVVIIASLCLASLGMSLLAMSSHFWISFFGSLIMGIGSGGANIPALGVVAKWFAPKKRGLAMGIVNSGSGLGIVFSGVFVPVMIGIDTVNGWRFSWIVLACLILLIAILVLAFLKKHPQEVGIHSNGEERNQTSDHTFLATSSVYKNSIVWHIGFTYFLWGFSYLVFSTFIVDYLMNDIGFTKGVAGQYFAIGGFISIFSGFIWGAISDKIGRIQALTIVYGYQCILLLLMSLTYHPTLLLVEVILYGIALWAVPTITVTSVSEYVEPALAPIALGFLTLFFGVGQFFSPIVTGILIDQTNSYYSAFVASAIAVCVGCFASWALSMRLSRKSERVISSNINRVDN
ncbi:MFS transporter [Bacillus salitolerans]|uniref:MFS transporter n=1 Tax=Bacillus salitolerans TaxID=1437434 RepID=A0ABW4LQB0_9BACI